MNRLVLVLVAACSAPAASPAVRPTGSAPAPARIDRDPPPAAETDPPPPTAPDPSVQTALKTRAHPFALYIARMHRKLHERWAFGFLAALANKPVTDPLNDPALAVQLEIAIADDGSVAIDVVRPSNVTAFDQAAVQAFEAAAPFDAAPDSIRSADGRVHMRWTLHRDQRECSTAGVEPLMLGPE